MFQVLLVFAVGLFVLLCLLFFVLRNRESSLNSSNSLSIKAVHCDDMEGYLRSLEEYDKVMKEEVSCFFCPQQITLDNIIAVFPYENEVEYACDNCMLELINFKYN